ncbi:MAG: membrane protein insertase YidC [Gemmatimonadaceae bacterium]
MMDKRLFLAFTLSGLVVVATPFLFPRAKTPPAPAAAVAGDSQRAAATPPAPSAAAAPTAATGAPTQAAGSASAPTSITAAPASGTIGAGAAPAAAGVPVITAETIAVNTKVSHTHFSTLGAAPFLVELPGFKSLGASKGVVSIYQRNEPLLRYRVLAGNDTIDLSKLTFSAQRATRASGEQEVTFHATSGATDVTLQYAMQDSTYLGTVKATVRGTAAPAFLLVDLPTGFVSQEGDTMGDITALAYAVKPQKGGAKGIAFRKLDPGEQRLEAGPMLWATAKNKYFIVGMLASEKAPTIAEVKFEGGTRTSKVATRGKATAVLPLAADGTTTFDLYSGPQNWERMRALGRDFENANPYGGFMQGIVQPFATIVMRALLWMKRTTQLNYGWVLIIFGVAIRLLMWPLNQKAMRASMKLQVLQPELQAVQAKYKSDPQKQQAEIMKLYSEHGMSPLSPLLGCLPMLLPMPILFALFFVFQNTIEFRGVAFMWLPDISLKDPFYVLPLLMGASMYVLSWIGLRNAPPNPQAKMMAYLMPAMMTFFLINFASGLNLYYTVQNLAALPQQWLIANERLKKLKG